MPLRHIILAILVPCIMGFGFVISKPAMDYFPPILLNGLRWSISGLVMFWFFPFPKKYIKKIFYVSTIGCTLQYSLTFSGLKMIDASSATLFVQAEVPFGIIIAFFLLGEKPTIKNIIGLFIAFTGIIILSGDPKLEGKFIGVILVLLGAFTWALAQNIAKPVSQQINPIALTAWIGVLAGPLSIFVSYLLEGNTFTYIASANFNSWIILIYLGLIMNVLGYSLWYFLLSKYPVNLVMPSILLVPVAGLLTAVFLLGENITFYKALGGSIIIFGVALILFNKKKVSV
tara:strand:- start:2746 stop:3606 length:861 start_codon:yes stop_codon:yes gene_type:complete